MSTAVWPGSVTRYENEPDAKADTANNILKACSSFFSLVTIRPIGTEDKIAAIMMDELANPAT